MSLIVIPCDCPLGYNHAHNCPNCSAKNRLECDETTPLDVWLKMYTPGNCQCINPEDGCDCGEESEYEANTYPCRDGGFTVKWYHTAVGQVSRKWFVTYDAATAWLESEGFDDYSS